MAGAENIDEVVDLDAEDEGEESVRRLQERVVHRKGRGFQLGRRREPEEVEGYESLGATSSAQTGESEPQRSAGGWVLFVTSIHEEASEEDLTEKFSEFGPITHISLNLDRRTGYMKGYAMVEYSTYEQANAAREALDGSELLGQTIGVNWCFVKGPAKNKHSKSSTLG